MAADKPFSDMDPVRLFPEKGYRGQAAESKDAGDAAAPAGRLRSLRVPDGRAVILHRDPASGAAHGRLLELTADASEVPGDWQKPKRIAVEYRPWVCPGTGLAGARRTLREGILDRAALARLYAHGAPPRSLAVPRGWSVTVVFADAARTVYHAQKQELFAGDLGLGDLAYAVVRRWAARPLELRGAADHAGPALALEGGSAGAAEVAAGGIRSVRLRPGAGLLLARAHDGDPFAGPTRLITDDVADLEPEWRMARAIVVSCPVVYDASHQAGAWRNLPEGGIHGRHLAELLPEGAPIRRLQAPPDRPLTAVFLDGKRRVVRAGALDVDPRIDPLERLETRPCVVLAKGSDQDLPLLPGTWLKPDVDTGPPAVSSARVPPGWKAALHTEDDLGGAEHVLTGDADVAWAVASAEIRAPAEAFSRPGLRGVRRALGVGTHGADRLPGPLASLQVPPGTAVVLCREAGDLRAPVRICLDDVPALEPEWQQPAEARVLACPVVFGAQPLAGDTVNLLGGRWARERLAARLPAGTGPCGLQLPRGWRAVIESSMGEPAETAHGWTKLEKDFTAVVLRPPAELAAIAAGPAVFAGEDQQGEARLLDGSRGEVAGLPPAVRSLRTPPGTLLTLILGSGGKRFAWRHATDAPAIEVHATGARLSACPAFFSGSDYKGLARGFAGEGSTTGSFASARVPAGWKIAVSGMSPKADGPGFDNFSKELTTDTAKVEVKGGNLTVEVTTTAPTLFAEKDFKGTVEELQPGRHALGKAVGSLRLPPGWEVTLHLREPDDGKAPAASWRVTEDLASLPDAWARPAAATAARLPVLEVEAGNDSWRFGVSGAIGKAERGRLVPPGARIAAVELFEHQRLRVAWADGHAEVLDGPRRVDDPEAAHGPITALAPEPTGREGVVIHEQAHHRGPAVVLPDGRWDAGALGAAVPRIRSLHVPLGRRVCVRAGGDAYAPALAFVAGAAALDLPLGLEEAVSEPCPVVYGEKQHKGKCRGLDVGHYAPALLATGGVRSLKVPAGWTVKLAWRNEVSEPGDGKVTAGTGDVEKDAGLDPKRKWRLVSVVVERKAPAKDVRGGVAWRLDRTADAGHHAYVRAAPGYPRADEATHRLDGQLEGGARVVESGLLSRVLELPADGAVVFGHDADDVFPLGFRGTVVSLFARALPRGRPAGGGRWRSSVVLSTAAPDFAGGWEVGFGGRVGLRVAGGSDEETAALEVRGPEVQPGQWVHLAVAIDPPDAETPTLRLYVDGERQCAIPQQPAGGSAAPRLWARGRSGKERPGHFPGLVLGRSASGPGCPFSGQVARLRVLDGALAHGGAPAELAALAAAELPKGVTLPLRPALSLKPFADAADDEQHPTRAARPGGGATLAADELLGAALGLPAPGAVWSTVRSGTGIAGASGRARAFTFTAWVRPDPAPPGGVARLARVGGGDTGWTLEVVTAGRAPVPGDARLALAVAFEGKNGPELHRVESRRRLPAGRWSHLAARAGGGRLALFVDGRKVAEAQAPGLPDPALVRWFEGEVASAPLYLGGAARAPFVGRLARVQLHGRAPDDAEIAELAAHTGPAEERPPEGALLHLPLRKHAGAATRDAAAWGLDAALTGRYHSVFDRTFGTVLELHPGDQLTVAGVLHQLDATAGRVAPFTVAGWYLPKSDQGRLRISRQLALELGKSSKLILAGAGHDLSRPWALWRWHHFAVSWDGRRYRAFIDGKAACEVAGEALPRPEKPGDADLLIEAAYGRFTHLRAWRRALTAYEEASARLADLPPLARGRVPLPVAGAPVMHLPLAGVVRVDDRTWLPDVSGHEGHGRALGRGRIVDSDLFERALLLAAGDRGVNLSSVGGRLAAKALAAGADKDDLQEISGIGPVLEGKLNAQGITRYRQLAAMGPEDVRRLDEQITRFHGRIERDDWVDQARELQHGFGEAAELTWCVWVRPAGEPVLHLGARKTALGWILAPKLTLNVNGRKVTADVTLTAGRWSHLALVAEGGKLRLLVDGGQVKEVAGGPPRLPMGSSPISVEGRGEARLAHLRLYGRALSAAELAAARAEDMPSDRAAELFPLELHLRGGDGDAAAFLDVAQTLDISIANRGRRAVRLPTGTPAATTGKPARPARPAPRVETWYLSRGGPTALAPGGTYAVVLSWIGHMLTARADGSVALGYVTGRPEQSWHAEHAEHGVRLASMARPDAWLGEQGDRVALVGRDDALSWHMEDVEHTRRNAPRRLRVLFATRPSGEERCVHVPGSRGEPGLALELTAPGALRRGKLPISNPSLLAFSAEELVAVAPAADGTVALGPLRLVRCTRFERIVQHTDGPWEYTAWRPETPAGFRPLGHAMFMHGHDPNGELAVLAVAAADGAHDPPLLAPPEGFERAAKASLTYNVPVWRPKPPRGYRAAGFAVTADGQPPTKDAVACVRDDLAIEALYPDRALYPVAAEDPGSDRIVLRPPHFHLMEKLKAELRLLALPRPAARPAAPARPAPAAPRRSLVLRFPPGVLKERDGIAPAGHPAHGHDRSGDWRVRLRRDADGSDLVELTALHDDVLTPGETTGLRLEGLHFQGAAGRLRVTLEGRLDHPDGTPLVGRRTAWLALRAMPRDRLVHRVDALHDRAEALAEATSKLAAQAGSHGLRLEDLDKSAASLDKVMKESIDADLALLAETRPPLDVGVAGMGSVCCDGAPNELRVVIRNTAPKALELDLKGGAPPFALHIRPWSAAEPWGLATEEDLGRMKVTGTGPGWLAGRDGHPVIERRGGDLVIHLRPTHAKALGGEPVTLALGGFPCSAHSGTAHLRLHYAGVGPLGREGFFTIPVRRSLQRALGPRHTSIRGDLELVSRPRLRLAHAPSSDEGLPPPDAEVFLDDDRRLRVSARELRLGPGHRLGAAGGAPPLTIREGGHADLSGEVSAGAASVQGPVAAGGELSATGLLKAAGGIHAEPGWAADPDHDLGDLVPTGLIVMWSGPADKLPPGWHLCDGTHRTPDLRSRFLLAQGSGYAAHATGGRERVHLSIDELPSHGHDVHDLGHTHSLHYHQLRSQGCGDNADSYDFLEKGDEKTFESESATTGVKVQPAGGGKGHENRPPYYALCFIMKA